MAYLYRQHHAKKIVILQMTVFFLQAIFYHVACHHELLEKRRRIDRILTLVFCVYTYILPAGIYGFLNSILQLTEALDVCDLCPFCANGGKMDFPPFTSSVNSASS